MRYTTILFLLFVAFVPSNGQVIERLDYCNCIVEIDQKVPVLNGHFSKICESKTVERGTFLNGEKDGLWEIIDKKGRVVRKINYQQGKLHGSVQLFYNNGSSKLTGSFHEGLKDGKWSYYSEKGKTLIEGVYQMGKPTGIWTIYDSKGKKAKVQYDYDNAKYLIKEDLAYHKNSDVMQNDNTSEFYILYYPEADERPNPAGSAPIGGFNLNADFFVDLVEIPLDYWDTNCFKNFQLKVKMSTDNVTSFELNEVKNHLSNSTPIYPFLVVTNPPQKISKVTHTELSEKLLEMKIIEALNFMPPWIFLDKSEVEIYLAYQINIPYIRK